MPNKLTMICYFQKNLKPSIKVEIEQQDQKSMNFEEIMQKIVNTEVKISLKSTIMVQDLDIHCFQGHQFFNNTISKMQIQRITAKDFSCPKKSKIKDLKSAPPYSNIIEPAKEKNKQKNFKYQQEHTRKLKEILVADDNTINVIKKKKHNINKIMYFNCNKKSHYTNNYTKPKNQHWSWQLLCR